MRQLLILLAVFFLLPASSALAGGGNYAFDGGSPRQQAQVRAALQTSSFDWDMLPQKVTVHIGPSGVSHATPGHVWLDGGLLNAGKFSWATVLDEFAHQVDFQILDPPRRALLQQRLGGAAWCYEVAGLPHSAYGCERFSSMLAWAYWPSKHNPYRPRLSSDETAAMPAAAFRSLLAEVLRVPAL